MRTGKMGHTCWSNIDSKHTIIYDGVESVKRLLYTLYAFFVDYQGYWSTPRLSSVRALALAHYVISQRWL
ncbi:MAG: hypothetical protein JOZ18_12150 [Chloroflexi bacterium]|nr:hypothetical protein [Chloroflexota bacterium]